MRDIQIKSTGNRWADAIIGAVVLVALYLLVAVVVGLIQSILGSAGTAHADDRGYLGWLDSHGYTYGVLTGTPSTALLQGNLVCNNIRYSGDARAGFNPISNSITPDYLIEGAQRELCPDTL